jgi:hypothetical protein
MMGPNDRAPRPAARRRAVSEEKTTPLAGKGWSRVSWPSAPPAPGGRGSQPPRPIERPARPRIMPVPPVEPPTRRGSRALLIVVCIIVGLTAAALVAEGILISLGKSPF